MTLAFIFGTRPEITKSIGIARAVSERYGIPVVGFLTGQQTSLVSEALSAFSDSYEIKTLWCGDPSQPGYDKDWKERFKRNFAPQCAKNNVRAIVGTGDTNSVALAAELAQDERIPFVHLEAGIRHPLAVAPFEPEEVNRRKITPLSTFHLCPGAKQRANLLAEGVAADTIHVLGDLSMASIALSWRKRRTNIGRGNSQVDSGIRNVASRFVCTCTFHRSTSLTHIDALKWEFCSLVGHYPEIQFVVCGRPDTRWEKFYEQIARAPNVLSIPALQPLEFQDLTLISEIILTDSAGVQQEGLLLNKPTIALRQNIELGEDNDLLSIVKPPFDLLGDTFWSTRKKMIIPREVGIAYTCQAGDMITDKAARILMALIDRAQI